MKSVERALAQHPVKVFLDENLPLADIDLVLTERVFGNLLENSAKYTPSGSVVEIGGFTPP